MTDTDQLTRSLVKVDAIARGGGNLAKLLEVAFSDSSPAALRVADGSMLFTDFAGALMVTEGEGPTFPWAPLQSVWGDDLARHVVGWFDKLEWVEKVVATESCPSTAIFDGKNIGWHVRQRYELTIDDKNFYMVYVTPVWFG